MNEGLTSFRVIEVAKILGVSKVTIYKKIQQNREMMQEHLQTINGVTYVGTAGIDVLRSLLTTGKDRFQGSDEIVYESMKKLHILLSELVMKRKNVLHRKRTDCLKLKQRMERIDRRN